jgi:hypothetical protein
MRRKLNESADVELAIAKSLNQANLSVAEVEALHELSTRDLMVDYELDHVLANKVANHIKAQQYRQNAQNQYTPLADFSPSDTSLTRSFPISETKKLTSTQFKSLVFRLLKEERNR